MKIVSYRNVFLTRSGIGLKFFRLIDETVHQYPGKKRHFWLYAVAQFFIKKKIRLRGKFFLIHNHWCPGYYHWITEALPRLLTVTDHLKGHTLVLPESFKGPIHESIEPLFKGKIYWIPQNRNLVVEDLLIPENPPLSGQYDPVTFLKLRGIYKNYLAEKRVLVNNGTRIYVSRSKAKRRKVVNENGLIPGLEACGFSIVCFEDYSFWQQVAMMQNAEIFVSIHGAGLANILFMGEKSRVIELQMESRHGQTDVLYKKFAETLGLKYAVLFCKSANTESSLYAADIFVDLNDLQSLLPLGPPED